MLEGRWISGHELAVFCPRQLPNPVCDGTADMSTTLNLDEIGDSTPKSYQAKSTYSELHDHATGAIRNSANIWIRQIQISEDNALYNSDYSLQLAD